MASIRRSSRIKSHLNSKCQLPSRNSVHLWSFLGQHNKDFHKQSWAFLPLCKGCSGRSLQVWCCCCGRAIDFRVLNRGEQPQVCGCTQCLKEFKRTSCKPPLPWVVYSWQYAGTTHRHYSIPWSSTNSRCFQSSATTIFKNPLNNWRLTSYSCTTFGCLTFLRIVISLLILSRSAWSLIFSFSKILMAT